TRSLSGTITGDVVSLTAGTATFVDKFVGTGKVVTLTGASLSGGDAGNYVLDSVATTVANITAKHITGNFTADNKEYDGNNSATVATRSLNATIMGDVVSLTGGTATFADKIVGIGKTVTLAGASLSGLDAGNYVLASAATTTANISKADATVVVTPYNVTYDGNPHTATYTITGVNGETGATVGTVDVSHTTHTDAGTYAADYWTFTGAANYNNIGNTTITDTISKANATGVVTGYSVSYDGQPHAATVTSITGVNGETGATVGSVDVSGTTHTNAGSYDDHWTFTGTANYNNIGPTLVLDTIDPKAASVTPDAATKVYGSVDPAFTGTLTGFLA